MQDFWQKVRVKYPKNTIYEGVVEHIAPYGIFLNIGHNKVKGFIPITELGVEDKKVQNNLNIGDKIKALIIDYTTDDRYQVWMSTKRLC